MERKQIRVDPSWDRLTQDAVIADNLGISYGTLKARQYEIECRLRGYQVPPRRTSDELQTHMCICCKRPYVSYSLTQGFCSSNCERRWSKRNANNT